MLDTNVVLDLWLFQDRRAGPLRHALAGGHLRALVSMAMLDELGDVLSRDFVSRWPVSAGEVVLALRACSDPAEPIPAPCPAPPRCADADDQKFIDLAWSAPAAWLFSRDRAVLDLARPARAHGLGILTPEDWVRTLTAAEPPRQQQT